MTPKHVIYAWLISVLMVPLFSAIFWGLSFVFYGSMFLFALLCLIAKGARRKNMPLLLMIQAAMMLILAVIYLNDAKTLLNILDIMFINIMMIMIFYNIPNDIKTFEFVFEKFRFVLLILAIFGIVVSTILSGPLDLDNPVKDLLSGDRVRIFSRHYGHSALIDVGILNLMITLSAIKHEGRARQILWAASSVAMIVVARSATGYTGVILTLIVWIIERSKIDFKIKNIIYVIAIPALVFGYAFAGDTIITAVRTFQVGARSVGTTYGHSGDLTAGRAELNLYLVKLIQGNELYGVGVKNRLLTDGVLGRGGQAVAVTESSLRIAAKFGIFYYFLIGLICASPLVVLFVRDRRIRILGLGMGAYCLDVFLLDSLFEVPHEWRTVALMIPVLLIFEFVRSGVQSPQQASLRAAYPRAVS